MKWVVEFHDDFEPEFDCLPKEVQDELIAKTELLKVFGPKLKRPHVDTLNGSEYSNMKELRFTADRGVWRVAFAFDPKRCAVLLVAGDKSGGSESYFYKQLIKKADARFYEHLAQLKESEGSCG
ncbi:type II toxin-antitoxin system RelE/ParE family toxin [Brasilonema sp. CT11]|nr:type II toxin-antitoxin system RelE/ParE family toxin [Brasilonema sp. CT11]